MLSEVKKALAAIEDVLLAGDSAVSGDLWDILAALRGPDIDQSVYNNVKDKTTVHIRRHAFPRIARRTDILRTMRGLPDFSINRRYSASAGIDVSEHFHQHITDAMRAIRRKK